MKPAAESNSDPATNTLPDDAAGSSPLLARIEALLSQMTLEENMTVVVQPNPVTTEADEAKRSGVQVGELMRITRDGCEPLHRAPRGLFRAGDKI